MRPEFTESTFSFAYTQELIKKLNLHTIPEFISQQKEAIKGYDVKISWKEPIFIQFKISDLLIRQNASESRLFQKMPYFRFKLHRDNKSKIIYNQHNLLCKLNVKNRQVYYCAPVFYKKNDLNAYFRSSNLISNSVLFQPSQMGNVWRKNNHKVVYSPDLTSCYFLSKPKTIDEIKITNFEKRETIILDKKYWLDVMNEIKDKVIKQIEQDYSGKKSNKQIAFSSEDKDINNLPTVYEDVSYKIEYKKEKIKHFTNELKDYDYEIMLKEIDRFLSSELNIEIVL